MVHFASTQRLDISDSVVGHKDLHPCETGSVRGWPNVFAALLQLHHPRERLLHRP